MRLFIDTHCRCLFHQRHLYCLSFHQICFAAIHEGRKIITFITLAACNTIKTHPHDTPKCLTSREYVTREAVSWLHAAEMWVITFLLLRFVFYNTFNLFISDLRSNHTHWPRFRLWPMMSIASIGCFAGDAITRGTAAALELPDAPSRHGRGRQTRAWSRWGSSAPNPAVQNSSSLLLWLTMGTGSGVLMHDGTS